MDAKLPAPDGEANEKAAAPECDCHPAVAVVSMGPFTLRKMPTTHLIHGFLGAGKTTFAKRLAVAHGAVRYSPDEWMVRLHGIDPPADRFAGFLEEIYARINAAWPADLENGHDVVLDFGFWRRAERDAARARAASLGAGVKLYALICPEETARARCRARNVRLEGSLFIADNTYDALMARFEPLAPDEPHVAVDTGNPPDP
jgi:hypothetical protein